MTNIQDAFLRLLRLGIGTSEDIPTLDGVNWFNLERLANEQGLLGVMLDGVEKLPQELRPEKKAILQSVGQLLKSEQRYLAQEHAAVKMALLLHQHGIRTYVLKGAVVSECYPRPEHRRSVDLDCFLVAESGRNENVCERGNQVIEGQGIKVGRSFYKNSSFFFQGLHVENHRYLTPFRGNKLLTRLESYLQKLLLEDDGPNRIAGTWLCRPPVMVSALFLIEHAYSHFLHEGLTIRHILDWVMFRERHAGDIDWKVFDGCIDEYGFRLFFDAYSHVGEFVAGDRDERELTVAELRMIESIWDGLDLHDTVEGFCGKLNLVGNTIRAAWKYRLFSPISMPHALWIQVKGFLFLRNPRLG